MLQRRKGVELTRGVMDGWEPRRAIIGWQALSRGTYVSAARRKCTCEFVGCSRRIVGHRAHVKKTWRIQGTFTTHSRHIRVPSLLEILGCRMMQTREHLGRQLVKGAIQAPDPCRRSVAHAREAASRHY